MPLPAALPPPARPPAKHGEEAKQRGSKGPSVDMDWDDEEESTHVYDKTSQDGIPGPSGPRPAAGMRPSIPGSAAALLASSGGAAAPAHRPSVATPMPGPPIPSAPPAPYMPAQAAPPPSRNEEATAIRPRPIVQTGGGSKVGAILGGLALVAVIAMAVVLFLPKKGGLTVDIKAPNGVTVAKAEVFIDGQKRCDTVPCVVRDLEAGSKTVKVIAPDFPPRDAVETVEAGKEKQVVISLEGSSGPSPSGTAAAAGGTGFKAASTQSGVKVFVDGAEKGTLPVALDLPAGSHKVRFEGGERYQKLEQTVDVTQGQMKDLGNVALKVVKGQVTLELATQGASVTLVNSKKVEKRLPDALWRNPPVQLDIDPAEGWKLVASKKGHEDFTAALTFEDGQAEKTVRIELAEAGKTAPTPPTPPVAGTSPPSAPAEPATAKTSEPATPPPAAGGSGQATLNINSIPVSKVVLDGRPLGSTPKVGVSVPPGSHTVTFIHPEKGKKSITVTVKGGETKTAAVKF
jgi:serine/threonine-protein kinase